MDDFIKITVLENRIEAQLIDSILSEKNIPHRIRSFHDQNLSCSKKSNDLKCKTAVAGCVLPEQIHNNIN